MHYFSAWNRGRAPYRARHMDEPSLPVGPPHWSALFFKRSVSRAMGRSGLTKTEADDLLDWLEANGCRRYELLEATDHSFAVRWWN